MRNYVGRATLAVLVAIVLLSSGAGTAASWSDSVHREAVTVTTGRLAVEPVSTHVSIWRLVDGGRTEFSADQPLVPGDTVRITSTVQVAATGDALGATLRVDASALTKLAEHDVSSLLTVATDSELQAPDHERSTGAQRTWTVTEDDDGATATAIVELTFPATTDGRAPAADRSNWWGQELQYLQLQPEPIRWTLIQEIS